MNVEMTFCVSIISQRNARQNDKERRLMKELKKTLYCFEVEIDQNVKKEIIDFFMRKKILKKYDGSN